MCLRDGGLCWVCIGNGEDEELKFVNETEDVIHFKCPKCETDIFYYKETKSWEWEDEYGRLQFRDDCPIDDD